jgi:hypothetical protein
MNQPGDDRGDEVGESRRGNDEISAARGDGQAGCYRADHDQESKEEARVAPRDYRY